MAGTLWSVICSSHPIPKIKSYMWKLSSTAIAVKSNLIRRGLPNVSLDGSICDVEETNAHMTFECGLTKATWFGMLGDPWRKPSLKIHRGMVERPSYRAKQYE